MKQLFIPLRLVCIFSDAAQYASMEFIFLKILLEKIVNQDSLDLQETLKNVIGSKAFLNLISDAFAKSNEILVAEQ